MKFNENQNSDIHSSRLRAYRAFLLLTLLVLPALAQGQVSTAKGSLSGPKLVASLPATGNSNILHDVRDALTATDCTVGGGTTRVVCKWNGSAYAPLPSVASGSTPGTVTTSGSPASPQLAKFSSGTAITTATAIDVSTPSQCADAGASDTYACSLAPVIASYVVGTKLRFFANTANTGAASINFNSLGALAIKVLQGTADPANGDIKAGAWVDCTIKVGSICEMTSTLGNAAAGGIAQITNPSGNNVVINSQDGSTTIGDTGAVGNGVTLTVDDVGESVTIAGGGLSVGADGIGTSGSINSTLGVVGGTFGTANICSDSAGAAACGAAAAGSVVIDAGSTSVVVSTTVVTDASQIIPVFDSSLGARLAVTCNTTIALPAITARSTGTSFTITVAVAPITNRACFSYFITN